VSKPEHTQEGPPNPPQMQRSLALRPLQIVGVLALALIPVLGAFGIIGERSHAIDMIGRVAFVYFFLMIAFRFAGKRELSEMSPFELVTLLLIPEIFSTALNKNDATLSGATISVASLFVLVFVTGLLTFRSRGLERVVEGEPAILIRRGRLLEETMKRERITPEEVAVEMHKAGIAEMRDVEWAILEVDGKISIIPRQTQEANAKRASG